VKVVASKATGNYRAPASPVGRTRGFGICRSRSVLPRLLGLVGRGVRPAGSARWSFFGGALLAIGLVDCERAPVDNAAPSAAKAESAAAKAEATANAPRVPPTADAPNASRTVSADAVLGEVRRLGGKGTLVNVWASWCGPCKHELPMLARLAADLAPRGVHLVLVSLDEPDDHDKAAAFLQEHGIKLPSYFAERPLGAFKQGMNPRWPGMVPATFLYAPSGALQYFWGGEAFEEELTPVISAFLAGKPIQGESGEQVAPEGPAH
jgi:thiol-disulfide isomerase/thioredoxin